MDIRFRNIPPSKRPTKWHTVYGVRDAAGRFHYVGMTRQNISRRASEHRYTARANKHHAGLAWSGYDIVILERVSPRRFKQERTLAEHFWIEKLWHEGHPLRNKYSVPREPYKSSAVRRSSAG